MSMSAFERGKLMSRVRSHSTDPEMRLRGALWARGLRYRIQYKIGKFKPDVVFVKARLAIFVDGCFWHQCPEHGVMPKSNREFWLQKLNRNVARDLETVISLEDKGWGVIRFWEHEIEDDIDGCV